MMIMKPQIETAQRAAKGQKVCGDAVVVIPGDVITIALADGLGHGPLAAEASLSFCSFVESNVSKEPDEILREASRSLAGTRGVSAALACIDVRQQRLRFSGVGNIELKSLSKDPIHPVSRPGIIGRRVNKVMQFEYSLSVGDLFVIHSDGISNRFDLVTYRRFSVKSMAAAILSNHGKDHDDATCVVIQC